MFETLSQNGRVVRALIIPQSAWDEIEAQAREEDMSPEDKATELIIAGLECRRRCGKPSKEIRRTKDV